jgi:YidC/Oxa1 family membrane protein insertase
MRKHGAKIELFDNIKGMFRKKPAASTAVAAPGKPANSNKK